MQTLTRKEVFLGKTGLLSPNRLGYRMALVFLWLISFYPLRAQNDTDQHETITGAYHSYDAKYGLDDLLFNGEIYVNKYYYAKGHAFLGDDQFHYGSVTIKGRTFQHIELKYDICNQQLLAKLENNMGTTEILVLQPAFIDSFSFQGKVYRPEKMEGKVSWFYQSLGDNDVHIALFHSKRLQIPKGRIAAEHRYIGRQKEFFLVIDGIMTALKKKRDIWKRLPSKKQAVRKFLRKTNITFRNYSDAQWLELVELLKQPEIQTS